ncbi:Gfo/Idh/MocA family protein [Halalkalibacter sp. APA_J-10(15)]|uniref:Gfo/Idh/MocA family protein n=1 Tax=Halalkalibacter sp. APA_J-10(15) TaxID=2933805 RepID=UPI001FF3FB92|nr:Gfo/Idh/MocA family oxidoreductase [Halalkalibacter sp. APA_J-10(15)]MCK0470488.1 Gfo/Idh/MocA family oxidoreductase [Halalkalibacter sp. APA_J-10(15)]
MSNSDGMNYQPKGKASKVIDSGEFFFAAIGLDHGHIYAMCNGLLEAGGELKLVYDPDSTKVKEFVKKFPNTKIANSEEEILLDSTINLVASARIPAMRCELGLRTLDKGKHFFVDKPAFTTKEQLEEARKKTEETGLKWGIYYSERLHVEGAILAGQLIEDGAIGKVVQVIGTGPHRANPSSRPNWFFDRDYVGGILCDIGSHQIEQFLYYAGAKDARVLHSKVANYKFKDYPKFEDFGDATLVADNGATFYFRVDWLTPDGLGTWGDGRVIILGTDGYIEVRKYIDIARDEKGDHVYVVNHEGEQHIHCHGQVGYPFFGKFILDCMNGSEESMSQEHAFKAAELCIDAQNKAIHLDVPGGFEDVT